MAGRGAPTFLKRQKELKRAERAREKRAAKQARRDSRAAAKADEAHVEDISAEPTEQDAGPDAGPED